MFIVFVLPQMCSLCFLFFTSTLTWGRICMNLHHYFLMCIDCTNKNPILALLRLFLFFAANLQQTCALLRKHRRSLQPSQQTGFLTGRGWLWVVAVRCFQDAAGCVGLQQLKSPSISTPDLQLGWAAVPAVRCWLEIFKLSKLEEIYQAIPDSFEANSQRYLVLSLIFSGVIMVHLYCVGIKQGWNPSRSNMRIAP